MGTENPDFEKLYLHLLKNLENKKEFYVEYMKKWIRKEINKDHFDEEIKEILTPGQLRVHNLFISQLIRNCSHDMQKSELELNRPFKIKGTKYERDREKYLDHSSLNSGARVRISFLISTWDKNMDAIELPACDLLIVSANNFIKNVLTAIIKKRKTFKIKDGCFSHAFGISNNTLPSDNPLRNSKMGIRDAIDAITVYPEVIPRHSLYLMFMEKLLLSQKQESWDEVECDKISKDADENFKLSLKENAD